MSNYTAGSYLGSKAEDPNAMNRRIFSERGNHQDALGTILNYCQVKSRFTVGSTDTSGFTQVLSEFKGVVDRLSITPHTPSGNIIQVVLAVADALQSFPDKTKFEKFSAILRRQGHYSSTFIHFCIQLEGDSLFLFIFKLFVEGSPLSLRAEGSLDVWAVNRDEMVKRADELANKINLKARIDEWTGNICSNGF